MTRQQRLTMLDLSSLTVGGCPGDLMDLGLGSMLESYLMPIGLGSDRFYLKSAPFRQIIQVSESATVTLWQAVSKHASHEQGPPHWP